MRIEKFIEKDFLMISPNLRISDVKEILFERSYVVVFDGDKYLGILTINDLINNEEKLVIDCMSIKNGIDCNLNVKDAIIRMLEENTSFLPVLKNGAFIGVINYNNCIEYVSDQINIKSVGDLSEKNEYEKNEKIRRAFLKNISHEIRTPLNAIIGFSELLVKNNENDPKNKYFAKVIRENTNELISIIEDLIEISQIESGEVTIRSDYCLIESIFEELYDEFLFEMRMKGKSDILLKFNIDDKFKNYLIFIDKMRLKQSLSYLINNSIKHTIEGKIEFGCKPKDSNILFYVKDTGTGITEEIKEEIFKCFTQTAKKMEYNKGAELSLFITRRIVELLGGDIWYEPDLDSGSLFCFILPLSEKVPGKKTLFY